MSGAEPTHRTAEAAFAPFEPRLFVGDVMHLRVRPKRHQFRYRVFCLWLDTDRLEETCRPLRRLGCDARALMSFHHADHGPRDGGPLRPWVTALLAAEGRPAPARIMLLCFPRVLGYVFNPLSVYYCYDANDQLTEIIYEVKNTFGDQHPYVARVEFDADGCARHAQDKEFFVSPFIDMEKTYAFTIRPPADKLALKIRESDADGAYLFATWNGEAEKLTDKALRRRFWTHPLLTIGVVFGIHWQALRLFLKGVRFLGHPGDENVVRRRNAQA